MFCTMWEWSCKSIIAIWRLCVFLVDFVLNWVMNSTKVYFTFKLTFCTRWAWRLSFWRIQSWKELSAPHQCIWHESSHFAPSRHKVIILLSSNTWKYLCDWSYLCLADKSSSDKSFLVGFLCEMGEEDNSSEIVGLQFLPRISVCKLSN